uniref:peptidylprolyl isomerase n=1 Tax=Heterosigma akashiwo TaxID=2829 RepID=A0A6S9GUW9_HETAK|mmetsp:Transcript_7562/g.12110  ORF Transcript_7562/g.12110 Transcript_7562/m.12110 type:complete len:229 (+) Transcript_7562:132-818(+)
MVKNCVFAFLLLVLAAASAFHVATMSSSPIISRRKCLSLVVGGSAFLSAAPGFSVEGGDPYGKEGRKEMESVSTQTPSPSSANAPFPDVPFTELPSGVKYKEFRAGAGAEVAPGSRVSIQITGRLLNLNGVKFYSTKDNIVDELAGPEPLIFTAGKGQLIPGLEEGILGMKKGGVRRIVVPAKLGYAAGPTLQPQPTKQLDKNALDSVLKNPRRDASLLFDVQVERLK